MVLKETASTTEKKLFQEPKPATDSSDTGRVRFMAEWCVGVAVGDPAQSLNLLFKVRERPGRHGSEGVG